MDARLSPAAPHRDRPAPRGDKIAAGAALLAETLGDEAADRLGPARRRVHPLKAWRMTQRAGDGAPTRGRLTASEACRRYSAFVGRTVRPQTWHGWERYEDEPGHRKPDQANRRLLFLFTRGAIRPDHFDPIDEWRRELRALIAKDAQTGG